MSRLGPEAGYIIVAVTRVPLGALLLSAKTKLLVFIAPLSIGPGKKEAYRLPATLQILMNPVAHHHP